MRKILATILITLVLFVPTNVNAIGEIFNENNLNSCVKDGSCFLLCAYNSQAVADWGKKKTSVEVYYKYAGGWVVDFDSAQTPFNGSTMKNGGDPFYASDNIAGVFHQGSCPPYAFYETNGVNQVCFTQTESDCRTYDDDWKNGGSGDRVYSHIEKVESALEPVINSMSSLTCSSILAEENPDTYVTNKLLEAIKGPIYGGKEVPTIIRNSNKVQALVTSASTKYSARLQSCAEEEKKKIEEQVKNGDLTQEEADKKVDELNSKTNTLKNKLGSVQNQFGILKPNIVVDLNVDTTGCGLISSDFKEWLQWLLDTIRIAGLVLTVVLGVVDYMKASFASKEDAMKEANKNFSTRLLALALLLLVPTIITTALVIFNVGVTGDPDTITCGIK